MQTMCVRGWITIEANDNTNTAHRACISVASCGSPRWGGVAASVSLANNTFSMAQIANQVRALPVVPHRQLTSVANRVGIEAVVAVCTASVVHSSLAVAYAA